jgi:hypothetical protein
MKKTMLQKGMSMSFTTTSCRSVLVFSATGHSPFAVHRGVSVPQA